MSFYELPFIVRQDISSNDLDKITDEFKKVAEDNGGEVVKTEYWGLRPLAYKIKNNKKAHYVFLGLEATSKVMQELERRMKLNENIIRFMSINVDSISSDPSPILKSHNIEHSQVVDVTANEG